MTCPNMRFWAEVVNEIEGLHRHVKLPCRSWSCPECAKDNASRLRRLVKAGIEAWFNSQGITQAQLGYQVKLFTLTPPGDPWRSSHDLDEIERITKRNLNRLLQMLRKHRGLQAYVWVREVKGAKHLHYHLLVIGPGIAGKDILDFVRGLWTVRYGMGNVDVQLVRTLQGTVSYVTKYLTKGEGESRIANGKHYGISAALRSEVKMARDRKRKEWTVLKVGVLNGDQSFGRVLWEAPQVINEEDEWVRDVLSLRDELLAQGIFKKGDQFYLWEDE